MTEERTPSILYVDDDPANRRAFSMVLRHAGFDTREAATGGDALRLAADRPDLIILDVNLPDIDGFEVCRRIKAHPATSSIPVLHMSAVYVHGADKAHGRESGSDGYLTKPVEPEEVVATVHSLLRVHRAEEAARAAAWQWQAIFDAVSDAVCLLDPAGAVLRCNRAAAELFRRPNEELVSRPYEQFLRETFGPAAAVPRAPPGHGSRDPAVEVVLGGRWFRATADPVRDERGEPAGAVLLLADVTQRRALEEQLRQAQKMDALGRLAGGVAHDFNNLLTGVTGNLTMALEATPPDDPRREFLISAEQAAWRAAELTRQLLGFARRSKPRLGPVDLNACVREAADLLRRTLGPAVEIALTCSPGLWPVETDAGQIHQVLMNLCLNARDAMPEGGLLDMGTANVTVGAADARGRPEARSGEFVRLRVRDEGHGISEDVRRRIFEPFFTTKAVGKGTGLGLAVVLGIVKQHWGWIDCQSAVGEGTCFDVYLPRQQGATP